MGQLILAQMVVLADLDPDSQRRYLRFVSEPLLHPLHRTFSAAVIEETLCRYIGMTAVALVVARRLAKPHLAYRVALISTAAVFALGHLPALSIVGLVIVFFNMLAGLLYGWMFWHWELDVRGLAHLQRDP
jgi:membrane protease YdiL (CAAX protease family)